MASVAPGLFVAGMSVVSTQLGRTFALVEWLRAEAALLVGPVLLHLAMAFAPPLSSGLHLSLWITLGLAVVGTIGISARFALGGRAPATARPGRVAGMGRTCASLAAAWRLAT